MKRSIYLVNIACVAAVCRPGKQIQLVTLVTGVHYRHTGLLAKIVTTLDTLSSGRAFLGIGAGWKQPESRGLGAPFPPLAERFERLEDTVRSACNCGWARSNRSTARTTHWSVRSPQSLAELNVLALFLDAVYLPTPPSGQKEGVQVA